MVVSGQMHGTETTGPLVVDELRRHRIPVGGSLTVWTIATMNPDGSVARGRYDARGVDLNGNFPIRWVPRLPSGASAGARPLSEPESQAMARFLTWVQPDLLVSYHGYLNAADTTGGGLRAARARSYAALTSLPARVVSCGGPCHGNLTDWYSAATRVGGVAFTVEMPPGTGALRRCRVPGHAGIRTVAACAADAFLQIARTG